jgi:hypothetical protein
VAASVTLKSSCTHSPNPTQSAFNGTKSEGEKRYSRLPVWAAATATTAGALTAAIGPSAAPTARTTSADYGCDTDGHIPAGWFRESVWRPVLKNAGLMIKVRVHDLRHAHASFLAGGAVLQVVKRCLGHGSLRTTEKYLHTLPDADETALEALSRMRNPASLR